MQSKNKKAPDKLERDHIRRISEQACSVCKAGGGPAAPSEVHEIKQGAWFLSIPLCADCHRGSRNGLHGERRMWSVMKMDELDALAVTLRRLAA